MWRVELAVWETMRARLRPFRRSSTTSSAIRIGPSILHETKKRREILSVSIRQCDGFCRPLLALASDTALAPACSAAYERRRAPPVELFPAAGRLARYPELPPHRAGRPSRAGIGQRSPPKPAPSSSWGDASRSVGRDRYRGSRVGHHAPSLALPLFDSLVHSVHVLHDEKIKAARHLHSARPEALAACRTRFLGDPDERRGGVKHEGRRERERDDGHCLWTGSGARVRDLTGHCRWGGERAGGPHGSGLAGARGAACGRRCAACAKV